MVEADEYDYSFLWLRPEFAIINNLDYDHPDLFPDQDAYDAAFAAFAAQVDPGGILVIAGDDPGCARVLAMRAGRLPGSSPSARGPDVDWRVEEEARTGRLPHPDGETLPLVLGVPGRHNARNATAALAILDAMGFDRRDAAGALDDSPGSADGSR